jgi:predicted DNA-binding protein
MALADHTYSFRAPRELADRLRAAEREYAALGSDPTMAAHITRELDIGLRRRLRETPARGRAQGRILREVVEAFVAATEAAAREQALGRELREFDAADKDGAAERDALLRASVASDE